LLDTLGNVEGEGLHRLRDLHRMLPGCCTPDPVVVFRQSASQTHPRRGVRPTPRLPHALCPPIPQGVLPVSGNAVRHRLTLMVSHRWDRLAQLLPWAGRVGCAVRLVAEMPQRSDDASAAGHTTGLLAGACCHGRLCLTREMGGLLDSLDTMLVRWFPQRAAVGKLLFHKLSIDHHGGESP